ncbi:glycosyltransferase, partial [Fibrobacterota bacterium]
FISYFRSRFPEKAYYHLPNVPYKDHKAGKKHILAEKPVVLIYQGYLRKENSLHNLLSAISSRRDYELIIVGEGPELENTRKQIDELDLGKRVDLIGSVPFEKLSQYTRRAHIGIHPVYCASLNIDLTLPNKIFDYTNQGLPVLMGRTTAIGNLLKKYPIGVQADVESPSSILQGLDDMVRDYETLSDSCMKARKELCWENYEKGLRAFLTQPS